LEFEAFWDPRKAFFVSGNQAMPISNTQRNPGVLCAIHAFHMMLFPIAIMPLFWRSEIGMSVSEILLVQALFGIVVVVRFASPAHRCGRRSFRSAPVLLAVGAALTGIASVSWFWFAGLNRTAERQPQVTGEV
jgi:hypothetical protein